VKKLEPVSNRLVTLDIGYSLNYTLIIAHIHPVVYFKTNVEYTSDHAKGMIPMAENQRVRITKKMLKDCLVRLLSNESIHKISVREICDGAQINRTTFYKYYGSQYDLLEDMENDVLTLINNYLHTDYSIDDYTQQLIKVLDFINENIDLCRVLLNNSVDPDFPEKLIYLPSIQQIISRNLPDKYSEDEMAYVFDFIINGGFSVIKKWLNKNNRESPERIAALLNITIVKLFPEY